MFSSWSWLRDPRLLGLFAGFAVVGVGIAGSFQGEPTCSAADPCLPSQFGSTSIGLLLGSMIATYVHWRTAAWLAVGTAVTFVVADLLDPTMPWWTYVVLFGYVAVYWYLPDPGRQPAGSAVATTVAVMDHRPAPRPVHVPVIGRHWLALAAVLAIGTAGMSWWGLAEQDRKDAQQQAAQVVTGVVREHRDEFTARVGFPDGRQVDVDVLDVAYYPVGSPMKLYVDGQGLSQPVSEPYDATGWLVLAAITAAVAVALARRTVDRNTALRRLFSEAQPVRAVGAVEDWRKVHLYLPSTAPGRTTLVTVPMIYADPPDGHTARLDGQDDEDDGWDPDDDTESDPVPAVLYGDPQPGRWCAVEVDGRVRLPRGPVRSLEEVPAHPVTAEHPAWADEPPVDLGLLTDADRQGSPSDLRYHRAHPLIRWAQAMAAVPALLAPVGLVITGPLDSLSFPMAIAITAPLTAVALFQGWRRHLRPYLCWNAGGLVLVTTWRVHRLTWSAELRVDGVGSEVSVLDDHSEEAITVWARRRMRLLPAAPGERTAEQLRHALRYAREQAVRSGGTVPPPVAELPRPPFAALLVCWAVLAPVAAAMLR